jgi:anaerobic magnesium-protoporphyrin IX monomethyl ester cyclase
MQTPASLFPRRIDRVALIYPVATFMPPLGLMTLGSMLEQMGKEVCVVPMYSGTYGPGDAVLAKQLDRLAAFAPDLIGIGFMSAERQAARSVLEMLTPLFPEAVFVAGGRHPSCFPEEVLGWGADFSVVGEGETTLAELLQALEHDAGRLGQIPGLARLDEEGRVQCPVRPKETADLDIIPAYHLVPYQKFIDMRSAVTGRYLKSGWLATSRGCFSRCIYCRDVNFGGRLRLRSLDVVEADMELQARQYDLECFYIIDDMFAVNEARVLEFCRRFKGLCRRLGKRLLFAATARTDTLTRPMVAAMAEAGCTQLSIGVESGSQRVHDFLRTGKRVETVIPAFELLQGTSIDTFINLIVGVPVEREEDIDQTRELLAKIKPTTVSVTFLTAYPGTPLFDLAMKNKWLTADKLQKDAFQHSCGQVQLDIGLNEEVLLARREGLYRSTFSHTVGAILRRREVFRLGLDTIFSFVRNPRMVARMFGRLMAGDVNSFKDIYRQLNFERGLHIEREASWLMQQITVARRSGGPD